MPSLVTSRAIHPSGTGRSIELHCTATDARRERESARKAQVSLARRAHASAASASRGAAAVGAPCRAPWQVGGRVSTVARA